MWVWAIKIPSGSPGGKTHIRNNFGPPVTHQTLIAERVIKMGLKVELLWFLTHKYILHDENLRMK